MLSNYKKLFTLISLRRWNCGVSMTATAKAGISMEPWMLVETKTRNTFQYFPLQQKNKTE